MRGVKRIGYIFPERPKYDRRKLLKNKYRPVAETVYTGAPFPKDVMRIILPHLSFIDIVRYRRVCKQWNAIILYFLGLPKGQFERYRQEILERLGWWTETPYKNFGDHTPHGEKTYLPPHFTPWTMGKRAKKEYPSQSVCGLCNRTTYSVPCMMCDCVDRCAIQCPTKKLAFRSMRLKITFKCFDTSWCINEACRVYAELATLLGRCFCTEEQCIRGLSKASHIQAILPVVFKKE